MGRAQQTKGPGTPAATPSQAAWVGLLLCACTGSIEPYGASSGEGPGGDPSRPWAANGSMTPGAPGTGPNGVPGAPGSPGQPGGNGALPGQPGSPSDPAVSDPNGTGINMVECITPAVGPTPLRRLTHSEYDNSVRDLLGDATRPGASFAKDTQVGLFDTAAKTQTVPVLLADQYLDAAVSLAETANVTTLLGCTPAGANGGTCLRGFVDRFARRAFRRPLTAAEGDRLVAMYTTISADSDSPTGVRAVVAAVLSSPNFLFKPEVGGGPSALPDAKVSAPFELAGRLASLIWASVPDDMLLDAAAAGQLATKEQVAEQARRMLADDRAKPALSSFYYQWFGLDLLESATKDKTTYPKFDDALRDAMAEETKRFVDHVLWEDDAKLTTLLTAEYSFLNKPLAELYGLSGPTSATTFVKTPLDKSQRLGVLTQASVLSTFASPQQSSPVKRGKWVRVRVLCQDLPDPPANVPQLPGPEPGVTTRERFAMHTNNDACRGCHQLIDGLGFGLEAYDGIGGFRTMDQGAAVDSSGEVNTTRDIDGVYDGGPALAGLLAQSTQVRDCAPTQWLRYALGREEEEADSCSIVALRDAFGTSGGDLKELVVALTQTDAFMNYRQPE
jgi:hypothetical protein